MGQDDIENRAGSWPLNNIELANALKMSGYDFHFRFGTSVHAIAQGALDLPGVAGLAVARMGIGEKGR